MVTDVAGQPIIAILKGQAIRQKDCSTLGDGTDWSPETSIANYQPTLRNILEERRPQVYRWKSLELCSLRGVVGEITV